MSLPEPLTPAGCDLRDFPRLMIDIPRLFASSFNATASRKPLAWMVGHKLWYRSWHQLPAGSLPNDDDELCHLAELGFDTKSFAQIKTLAMRGWVECSDGRLYHPVVSEAALEGWQEKLRQRLASGKGNETRWGVAFDPHETADDLRQLITCLSQLNPQSRAILKAKKSLAGIAGDVPQGSKSGPSGKVSASHRDMEKADISSLETGTETIEEEESFALVGSAKPKPVSGPSGSEVQAAFDQWNDLARRAGLPTARDFTKDRKQKIASRLRIVGPEGWASVLATIEASDFCRGGGERAWRISLDDLFQTRMWNKLRDGGFGAVVTPAMPAIEDIPPERWAIAMKMWAAGDGWSDSFGPAPDQPGNRVPREFLIGTVGGPRDASQLRKAG